MKVDVVRRIDLNADLGEGMANDEAMLALVSSANVACGGHAGDHHTMAGTLAAAANLDVAVGAHPSFEDREGFGRRVISVAPDEIQAMVSNQVRALLAIAATVPTQVRYIKLHGALAHRAAVDAEVAKAVIETVATLDERLGVLAISGTELESVARKRSLAVFSEVFADRGYRSDGQLVPRGESGAMLTDPAEAVDRILSFLETGLMPTVSGAQIPLAVDSICVHGDNKQAVELTSALRDGLMSAGFHIAAFAGPESPERQ